MPVDHRSFVVVRSTPLRHDEARRINDGPALMLDELHSSSALALSFSLDDKAVRCAALMALIHTSWPLEAMAERIWPLVHIA